MKILLRSVMKYDIWNMVSAGTRKLNILSDPPCSAHPPSRPSHQTGHSCSKGPVLYFIFEGSNSWWWLNVCYVVYFSDFVNCISLLLSTVFHSLFDRCEKTSACVREKGGFPFIFPSRPIITEWIPWWRPLSLRLRAATDFDANISHFVTVEELAF